jgi:tetratricopeptide (TPR) repeat protein
MKRGAVKSIILAAWAAGAVTAAPVAPPPPPDAAAVGEAIRQLGDESYAVRESATRVLWSLGEKALPELRDAAAGRDPEAAIRARDLLRKIELGILPDSSPKIVELVLRYDRGGNEERQVVINELKRQQAWRQILKLYALEKNAESLEMLADSVKGVAIEAARGCLCAEPPDVAGAFAYLRMARPEPSEFMAMAALHRATGSLDAELKKSAGRAGENAALWRYSLQAVAGRPLEAAVEAEQAGLDLHAARLRLLAGDPLPWLEAATHGPQVLPSAGLSLYREAAARRWEGKDPRPDTLRQLRRMTVAGDEDEQLKALRLLFLLGDHAEAEKRLIALDPRAAFHYFESAERIEEALGAFGIDPEKPDFVAWSLKRFRVFLDRPDDEEHELTELGLMGNFLERRGMAEELDRGFAVPLAELAAADQEVFIRVAARLFSGPIDGLSLPTVTPVVSALAAFAGDDDVRWMMAVENLFDRYERPDRLWTWLATVEPAMEKRGRFELLCRLYGLLPDPDNRRAGFFDKAWDAIGRADKVERPMLMELMTDLADAIQDSPNFVRGAEAIGGLGDGAADRRFKGSAYAAVERWADSAAEWVKLVASVPADPAYRAYAAAALRRAGNESAAAEQERMAELLALGETIAQFQCAEAFGAAGDFERAARWWRRAAVECTNQSSAFSAALVRLGEQALAEEDWVGAAAFGEAQALQQAMSGAEGYRSVPIGFSVSSALRLRVGADLARAFSRLAKSRAAAIASIERTTAMPGADLALSDHYFAPMRAAGLVKIHDQAFERLWGNLAARIARYPENDNTRNSAAWLASRANRRLDEAEAHLVKALASHPRQAAYLDTMAEVHFARGDRAKALEFSRRSLAEEGKDLQLIRQHERFKSGPLPPK